MTLSTEFIQLVLFDLVLEHCILIYVAHEFEMQLFIRFILELVDHNLHARLLLLLLLRQKAAHFLQIP